MPPEEGTVGTTVVALANTTPLDDLEGRGPVGAPDILDAGGQRPLPDDPYPGYAWLRAHDPVHWDAPRQCWLVTRYADVLAGLRDPRLSSARSWDAVVVPRPLRETVRGVQRAYATQLLFRDAPEHTRLRRALATAFTPRVVAGMVPLIQRLVDQLLDAVAARGQMDVIADLAYPLPTSVIASLLGLPPQDMPRLKAWSTDMGTTYAQDISRPLRLARAYRGVADLLAYMADAVAQCRRTPRDDLMQTLVTVADTQQGLTAEEVVANCAFLLFTGHETTTNLIGNGLLALLRHPDQVQRLRADPTLIDSAVEELLRYDSPVQAAGRIATTDMQIGDRCIRAGQYVALSLGAANRDPAQFAAPDRLDLARRENRHLAFGFGMHYCLGAALGRLEGQIAIRSVLSRWPRLRLATDQLVWHDNPGLRGLQALPVHLGAAATTTA
jgi:cytochrome P450